MTENYWYNDLWTNTLISPYELVYSWWTHGIIFYSIFFALFKIKLYSYWLSLQNDSTCNISHESLKFQNIIYLWFFVEHLESKLIEYDYKKRLHIIICLLNRSFSQCVKYSIYSWMEHLLKFLTKRFTRKIWSERPWKLDILMLIWISQYLGI